MRRRDHAGVDAARAIPLSLSVDGLMRAAMRAKVVPEAAEAMAYFLELSAATDKGSRLLAELLGELVMPEMLAIMPRLKPPPKKRGRKPGRSKKLAEIDEQAYANAFAAVGREPTMRARALERARLVGIANPTRDEIENIERDLRRQRRRTKTT